MDTVWAAKMQGSSCACWGSVLPHATQHHAATSSLAPELKPHWVHEHSPPPEPCNLAGSRGLSSRAEGSLPVAHGLLPMDAITATWLYTAHSVPAWVPLAQHRIPKRQNFPSPVPRAVPPDPPAKQTAPQPPTWR